MKLLRSLATASTILLLVLPLSAPVRAAVPRTHQHDVLVLRVGDGMRSAFVTLDSTGLAPRRLPLGLVDGKAHTLYTAAPLAGGHSSLIRAIDVLSGRTLHALTVVGVYSTARANFAAATLSFDGHWLALQSAVSRRGRTDALVVDTTAMRPLTTVHLTGRFGLDAIDAEGSRLYLIESLSGHGPGAYRVRSYEIAQHALDPGPIAEKSDTTGTMSGVAWTRAWSPDGKWLFTLYVHPGHAGAFIHALGVEYRIAQCIFLPRTDATAAALAYYTLAVSPDATALYAVNPLLGHATAIRGSLPYGSQDQAALPQRAGSPPHAMKSSVMSSDGRTVFVATNGGVWAVDTRSLAVRATYLKGQEVASVAFSRNGQRLYALVPRHGLVAVLDPTSGRLLRTMPEATGAWGIAQVTSE